MAEGYNRVILLGNLGADPELKATAQGQSVLKLRLATTERYQDKNGQWVDRTDWHSVVVWGKRAEGLHKFLTKGMTVFVEGSLKTSTWEDRDGNKRYKTEVMAKSVIVSGGKGGNRQDDSESPRDTQRRPQRQAPPPADDDGPPPDLPEDDLPF
jgi:single-strand DNA-binding protein